MSHRLAGTAITSKGLQCGVGAMRIAVLILALLGAFGSQYLAFRWEHDVQEAKVATSVLRIASEMEARNGLPKNPAIAEQIANNDRLVSAGEANGNTAMGAAALSTIGMILLFRLRMIAGLVFLFCFLVPITVAQDGKIAIYTFGLALAALCSFFVKPLRTPLTALKKGEGISKEDNKA